MNDIMRVANLFLEDFDFIGYVVATASIWGCRAVSAALWDTTMSILSSWSLHAQIPSVILTIIPVLTVCVIATEERVEEVAGQGLRADLIITPIHINRFLKTKGMDTLKALPFILDLLGVWEVRQGHSAIIELRTALLLLSCS